MRISVYDNACVDVSVSLTVLLSRKNFACVHMCVYEYGNICMYVSMKELEYMCEYMSENALSVCVYVA